MGGWGEIDHHCRYVNRQSLSVLLACPAFTGFTVAHRKSLPGVPSAVRGALHNARRSNSAETGEASGAAIIVHPCERNPVELSQDEIYKVL